MIDLNIYK